MSESHEEEEGRGLRPEERAESEGLGTVTRLCPRASWPGWSERQPGVRAAPRQLWAHGEGAALPLRRGPKSFAC